MEQKSNNKPPKSGNLGLGTAIGVSLGVAIGMALRNIPIGIALGAGVGTALGAGLDGQSKRKSKSDDIKPKSAHLPWRPVSIIFEFRQTRGPLHSDTRIPDAALINTLTELLYSSSELEPP